MDQLARRLQAWVEQTLSLKVPILERAPGPDETAIVSGRYGSGDLYSGNSISDSLHLVNLRRPDTGLPLRIALEMTEHQESGQFDHWEVVVEGALDGERDALRDLFDPRHHRGSMNDRVTPHFTFNGEVGTF